MARYTDTMIFDDAGDWQVLKEMTISKLTTIGAILIDLSGLTSGINVKIEEKVDGSNYKQVGNLISLPAVEYTVNLLSAMEGTDFYLNGGMLMADSNIKISIKTVVA